MRTGIATIPLDYGRCPYWLFERMKKLARGIVIAIREEFGPEEFLKRMADPVWFQSLGCLLGFDWNSSGLTTTSLAALKEGVRGLESDLGIFVCGGKGKTSKKTPRQIQDWGEFLGLSMEKIDRLVYTSKISAKVDSSALQDGFQIYTHNLIFTKSGHWSVIQQGMNIGSQKARRYHWLSSTLRQTQGKYDFVEEPHSGIISDGQVKPLNLTAQESGQNRQISSQLVKDSPRSFLRDIGLIQKKKEGQLTLMEMPNAEFAHHPVEREKFDLKRLEKTIFLASEQSPQNFEQVLALKGVGPKTIRALSLVSEIIYGAKPSYEDPARYSFSVGGKDGTPFPIDRQIYDQTIKVFAKGIKKSHLRYPEKQNAFKRLTRTFS